MGTDIFSMALDALMVVAITGLWVMWFLQAGQRKKVEKMLTQASSELQEATQLLDQVMKDLAQQKTGNERKKTSSNKQLNDALSDVGKQDHLDIQSEVKPDGYPQLDDADYKQEQRGEAAYSAQIMRLNREGLSPEAIAEKLDVPIAQIKLMLLLQAPKV